MKVPRIRGIEDNVYIEIGKRFGGPIILLVIIAVVGTIGYRIIGGNRYSLLDSFYMTFITLTTIGYGEVVDLSNNPAGRIFTIFISLSGIGVLFYILSNFTAFVVEGEITESFRRKKMDKAIQKMRDHYIICGIKSIGCHVTKELRTTGRQCVLVDIDKSAINDMVSEIKDQEYIIGDATDDSTLLRAGIKHARGLFAVAGSDNQNLVIILTARQLNPDIKIVGQCNNSNNSRKMKTAGADTIVFPDFIGGLRIVSEMIRPSVVSFLDIMLRDKDKNLRIEEIKAAERFVGKSIAELNIKGFKRTLLLAIKTPEGWTYNPHDDFRIGDKNILVFMTTPDERVAVEKFLQSGTA